MERGSVELASWSERVGKLLVSWVEIVGKLHVSWLERVRKLHVMGVYEVCEREDFLFLWEALLLDYREFILCNSFFFIINNTFLLSLELGS